MPIVRVLIAMLLAGAMFAPPPAHARSAHARIHRVVAAAGTMHDVRVDLDWPAGARQGALRLRAARLDAPDLGYRFSALDWRCVLTRDGWQRWHCDGPARTATGTMRLEVDLTERGADATLVQGTRSIHLQRRGDAPDVTRIDLASIPLAWMRTLLAKAWPEAQPKAGEGDARLQVTTPRDGLRIAGPLDLRGIAFDTPDGRIAAEGMAARLDLDMLLGPVDRVSLRGRLGGGEALFGTAYLALADRMADVAVEAEQRGECCWRIPRFEWRDDGALQARGAAAFGPGASLRSLQAELHSDDVARLRDPYLSGWLGAAGLGDLAMRGPAGVHLALSEGSLRTASATLGGVDVEDPKGRFALRGLDGALAFSADAPVDSVLRWRSGHVYGVDFDATSMPMHSEQGRLTFAAPVDVPVLGGRLTLEHLAIQPANAGGGARADFGVDVQNLDIGALARALKLPAFAGRLSGRIPNAHYAAQQLTFDGGLSMDLFGGRLDVSSLSMERPFGVAPTLSADIAFDDLDLMSLTGVLGFGSITGRLDGRIGGLRLVDWQPVAFDAHLRTDKHVGVPQRISQRAVQDLSSVGDASFVSSLQSRLIGFFDDFGYSAIGIDCRLADAVCDMGGLDARGPNSFTIVRGGGIPWLTVVGINRRVDWPTLVERLVAVGKGDAKPVVR